MKGKRLTNCLLVEAADGYRAVIALPELDPAFTDKQTVLALLRDGNRSVRKKGHTESSSPMKSKWPDGSGRLRL